MSITHSHETNALAMQGIPSSKPGSQDSNLDTRLVHLLNHRDLDIDSSCDWMNAIECGLLRYVNAI